MVSIIIKKGLDERYMQFDSETRVLSFDISKIERSDTGFKNFEVLLADSYGAEVEETFVIRIVETYKAPENSTEFE